MAMLLGVRIHGSHLIINTTLGSGHTQTHRHTGLALQDSRNPDRDSFNVAQFGLLMLVAHTQFGIHHNTQSILAGQQLSQCSVLTDAWGYFYPPAKLCTCSTECHKVFSWPNHQGFPGLKLCLSSTSTTSLIL